MGRSCGKLSLQFIKEESVRKASFKRRYQGLKKKIHELSTLCGVDACMITYGPMEGDGLMKLDTWPPNQEQVKKTINRYQQLDEKMKKKNSVGLTDFIKAQNKKIEQEFTNGKWIDGLSKDQLMEISATLDSKIHTIDEKIKLIDGNQRSQLIDEYHNELQNQHSHCNLMPMQKQIGYEYEYEYPSLPLMIPPHNNLYGDSTPMQTTVAAAPLMNPVMPSDFKDIYDLPNLNFEPLMIDYCPKMTNSVNLMNGYDFNNYYVDSSGEIMYFSDDQGASTSASSELYFSDQGASTSLLPSNMQSEQYYISHPLPI